ncbi:protein serrate-like [Ylistrum balloti]|uniref:protein serrate-like n=1 Tax=Ylistrum balloti TaxID=509963 RepID=UPI002905D58B|nr:protein serrate-like [Ylistrum balloti]
MSWCLIFHMIYGISQIVAVSGGGTGLVRLVDTTGATLDVCVGPAVGKLSSRCLYGRKVFKAHHDFGEIQVGNEIREKPHSLSFRFESLTTGLVVTLRVVRGYQEKSPGAISVSLTGQFDPIGYIHTRTLVIKRINITLEYILMCDEYYHGDCSAYCHPKHPMYDCETDGNKLCLTGWTGSNCDVRDDTCGTNPCRHGGTCTNIPHNHHFCVCTPQWTGHNCETPVKT